MGSFFTNYQVRSDALSAVRDSLAPLVASRAYVSPPKNGWITVYDEASDAQDEQVIRILGMGLSRTLSTAVLGFLVHDSDILAYWLWRDGELVDQFDSAPDYFGKKVDEKTLARLRGDAGALLPLCIAGTTRPQLEAVLHPPDGPPLMADEMLADLAELLCIEASRVSMGFQYFEEEGEEILEDIAEFEPVGKGAARKEARTPQAEPESFDPFVGAVGMLANGWGVRQQLSSHSTIFEQAPAGLESAIKKLQTSFDRSAREMLKHSNAAGQPTFEELKAARDQGPEALADLVVKRTPEKLTDIGVGAAVSGLNLFVAALLARGLDPNAKGMHGLTPLSAAELHRHPDTYRLLKVAAHRRGP